MGPTARGVGILRAMGGGTLITRWRRVAEAECLDWLAVGSWPPARDGDLWILDGRGPSQGEVDRLRVHGVRTMFIWRAWLKHVPEVDYLVAPYMENEDVAQEAPDGVEFVGRILPRAVEELDLERAERWWATQADRVLALQAGLGHAEARVVAARAGAGAALVTPYLGLGLWYWPAMELMPGARLLVSGGGFQTLAECAAVGVAEHVRVPMVRNGGEVQASHKRPPAGCWYDGARRVATLVDPT